MMQTDNKGLSKREKRLLMALLVVALTAGMVLYVILPLYSLLNDEEEEYSELSLERVQIDSSLAAEAYIRDIRDSMAVRHGVYSARYLNESLSNEIGRMLTALCESHRLQPIEQSLSAPRDFVIERDDDEDVDEDEDKQTIFLVVSASMTVNGDYSNLLRLLDSIKSIDYIRVSRVTYTWSIDPERERDRITINFEVTMIKDMIFAPVDDG